MHGIMVAGDNELHRANEPLDDFAPVPVLNVARHNHINVSKEVKSSKRMCLAHEGQFTHLIFLGGFEYHSFMSTGSF